MAEIQLTTPPHRAAPASRLKRLKRPRGEQLTRTLILGSLLIMVILPTLVWAWYL